MQSEWIALKQLAEWNSFISRSETSKNNSVLAIVVYLVLNCALLKKYFHWAMLREPANYELNSSAYLSPQIIYT